MEMFRATLRHPELIVKYNIGVKKVSEYDQEIPQSQTADNPVTPRGRSLLKQGISEPIFYGDFVYKF